MFHVILFKDTCRAQGTREVIKIKYTTHKVIIDKHNAVIPVIFYPGHLTNIDTQ